jgi:hypothetical protein
LELFVSQPGHRVARIGQRQTRSGGAAIADLVVRKDLGLIEFETRGPFHRKAGSLCMANTQQPKCG